jgi:hypothetical protein
VRHAIHAAIANHHQRHDDGPTTTRLVFKV